jgi:hypothetical protein
MGSGFDDWIYWHFFTITVIYNSSHIALSLNDVCLTNLYEESLATQISWTELISMRIEYRSPSQTICSFCYLFCPFYRCKLIYASAAIPAFM